MEFGYLKGSVNENIKHCSMGIMFNWSEERITKIVDCRGNDKISKLQKNVVN